MISQTVMLGKTNPPQSAAGGPRNKRNRVSRANLILSLALPLSRTRPFSQSRHRRRCFIVRGQCPPGAVVPRPNRNAASAQLHTTKHIRWRVVLYRDGGTHERICSPRSSLRNKADPRGLKPEAMITPLFECEQNTETVTVLIRVPHSRPRDFELVVDDCEFHFHCRPYLLHLRFPHPLETDEDTVRASYDYETGLASVSLKKRTSGLYFPHLGCLSALLVSRASRATRSTHDALTPLKPRAAGIEVVSSASEGSSEARPEGRGDRNDEDNDQRPQPQKALDTSVDALTPTLGSLSLGKPGYGFASRYRDVFADRCEDSAEALEFENPDETLPQDRRRLRLERELERFDHEHYLADFMQPEDHVSVRSCEPGDPATRKWTDSEKDALNKLPRREYLPDVDHAAVADLAGLLFAACYDLRTCLGERTVESAWTISRVCPSLSSLDQMDSVEYALRASYTRSLVYPLYRSVLVADCVLSDVKALVSGPIDIVRTRLLHTLMDVRNTFEESTVLRIFSDIYITDFCVWIQFTSDETVRKLSEHVQSATVTAADLPWDLARLERHALQVSAGEEPDDEVPVWTRAEPAHLTMRPYPHQVHGAAKIGPPHAPRPRANAPEQQALNEVCITAVGIRDVGLSEVSTTRRSDSGKGSARTAID